MITKNVNPDEVGKVFSIVGTFQALLPFAASPSFGFLYRATVEHFPAAFIFLIAGLKFVEGLVVFTVNIGTKLDAKKSKEDFKEVHEMHQLMSNEDQLKCSTKVS